MENQKVVIVGASHGGHESAIEILDKYEHVDVAIYEAGDFVSFMSCGMQLFLEDKVTAQDDVRNFAPADIESQGGHVFNQAEVTAINADQKTVTVHFKATDSDQTVPYDKLILSSGVTPMTLPVPGADLDNIYLMRGYDWATKIKAALTDDRFHKITVVGAGYIGIEAADVLSSYGHNKEVTLLDRNDHILERYLNTENIAILTNEFEKHGVNIKTGLNIESFVGENGHVTAIQTDQETIPTDLVIVSAGVKPNTQWLKGTINLDRHGFIQTDAYLRTNLPDVYAIGDAILPLSIPANKPLPIALATTARREAQYVVNHLFEAKPTHPFKGVVGSSALSVYDYHFATAGLNEMTARESHIDFATSFYEDRQRPAYIPKNDNPRVYVSLTYNPLTHQLLGGSVLSTADLTAQGNVLSLAIAQKLTLEDLACADFFFQPGFDRQWSLLNLAAQHALGNAPF